MPGRLQRHRDLALQAAQLIHQERHPGVRVLNRKDRLVRPAALIQDPHGVFALGHIDPAVEHDSTSCVHGWN